jgi:hypothetical protein
MIYTKTCLLLFVGIFFCSCSNLESVKPESRQSFMFYYGGSGNYSIVGAEQISDGFIVIGDSLNATGIGEKIILLKVGPLGNTIWRKSIKNASANFIKPYNKGYLIIGDSMYIDLKQSLVVDQIKRKMRLISLNENGDILADRSWGDTATVAPNRVDKKGSSLAIDNKGAIVTTSTVNYPKLTSIFQYTLLASHNPTTLAMKWSVKYNQDSRDYINSQSVHINGQNIIWATSASKTSAQTTQSFIRIPVFKEDSIYSTYVNASPFGENEVNSFYSGVDIKPNAVGYGIVGTFQTYKGENSNVFFLRTDLIGNPIPGSDIYFDGPTCATSLKPLDDSNKSTSIVQDQGISLTTTSDGGYLIAGYTTSTSDNTWGKGGKDVYLIRLDPFGNILWNKTFGGTGDEVPSTVRQTTDGGFLVSCTLTLAGQSSMFILKTDVNGELKN